MVSFTYTTIQNAILDFTEDDSDEFASNLPTILNLAQDRVTKDLDLEIFKQTFTGVFTVGNNYVNKPSGLLSTNSFSYIDANLQHQFLEPRTYDWCTMYAGNPLAQGTVKYYDDAFSDSQIYVVAAPAFAFDYRIRGLKRPDYLSDSVEQNWIATNAGDLLLYAALITSEGFLMSAQSGRTQEWEAEYQKILPASRIELAQLARHEYSPQASSKEPRE